MDKARLATRVTLKNQKGRWDRLKTILKIKDSEVAEILLDTLVHFLIITILPRPSASISIGFVHERVFVRGIKNILTF